MKKKYKMMLTIILAAFLLSVFMGFSYAIYRDKNINNVDYSLVETDEFISINYLDGKTFDIKDFKSGDIYTKKISVTNVSQSDTYLTISLMDVSKTTNDLMLKVIDSENKTIYEKNITNIDTELVKSADLAAGKTLSYTIMIENTGSEKVSLYANILAYKEIVKQTNNTFKDTLLQNNKIATAKTKVGEEIANTDEGLIKTTDDQGEAYYFRGNVLNNNVNFGNMDWKIVRINGNSSIRLVLDSVLDNYYAYNDNNDEVENYTTKLIYNNSKVKNELESWLNTNLQEYSKYIVDSVFCEDTSVLNEENSILYLNNYNRIFTDNTPTLTCMGNKISSKIGLLTADEVEFAGAYQKASNNNYFLHSNNINTSWWTMSGSQVLERYNAVDAISVNKDGSLSFDKKISTPMGIRPVISIDSNTVVVGDGTIDNPYIIKS
ncbi:MAG: hypothetical protein IJ572_01885 [Bacilli bacterium]|nr:hypothetical protein [Bacilli bacterium]